MSDNNGKVAFGELKATVELLCQRIDKIEKKVDELSEKLNNLNGKIIGAALVAGAIIGFILNIVK